MMRKKTNYVNITPIPSFIPRQLAIDILHSHGEVIELNPLVTGFEPIKAPRDAPSDEFYSTWYEISQRIQYVPGMGKLGSGKIKFKGCFHDMPWGLQTHIYAPANVDLRNKWQICGNQPGEPVETRELGIGAPPEGLYLREDIEIKCNVTMISFVKKETKAASKILVERLIKKAELLDSGVLQGMMQDGRLKTLNPADRSSVMPPGSPGVPQSPQPSPKNGVYNVPMSPTRSPTFPQTSMYGQQQNMYQPPKHSHGANNVIMELPGDYYHAQPSPSFLQPPNNRYSSASDNSGGSPDPSQGRWSQVSNDYNSSAGSRPSSFASDGMRSPVPEKQQFTAELPAMAETSEEHNRRPEGADEYPRDRKYVYNPQDYAHTQQQQPPQYTAYHQFGR